MNLVKVTVSGEPDTPPFTRIFDYEEEILFGSAKIVEEKIQRNMKVNTGEALTAYCACVIRSIRAGKNDNNIQDEISKILSVDKVMIGVPETLRAITFEVSIDGKSARKILIKQPIPAGKYMLISG